MPRSKVGRLVPIMAIAFISVATIIISSYIVRKSDARYSVRDNSPSPISVPFFSQNSSNVAVCLTGEARDLELTGTSILTHLLSKWEENVDLYISIVFNEGSYKMALFDGYERIKGVSVDSVYTINETRYPFYGKNLTKGLSPQGVLHQFHNLAWCSTLMESHRRATGKSYDWVVRTRLDSFWFGPPPRVHTLNPKIYTVPMGNRYWGVNDRLGVGNYTTSLLAFDRLGTIHDLRKKGFSVWSPEALMKGHMDQMNISCGFKPFSFCIMSRKKKRFKAQMVPIFSLTSGGPLNGAKCRPCKPHASGAKAIKYLSKLRKFGMSTVGNVSNPILCDGTLEWGADWEEHFDSQTPPSYRKTRREISTMSFETCVSRLQKMKAATANWQSPSPLALCVRRGLGAQAHVGVRGLFNSETFPTLMQLLNPESVVVSVSLASNWEHMWEWKAMAAVPEMQIKLLKGDLGNGENPKGAIRSGKKMRFKLFNLTAANPFHRKKVSFGHRFQFPLPVTYVERSLDGFVDVFAANTSAGIDLLKLDLHGHERELFKKWSVEKTVIRTCQLLVMFEDVYYKGEKSLRFPIAKLSDLDFTLSHCHREKVDHSFKCGFFSTKFCLQKRKL